MKIEAVVTCVDYADFLAETLPHNRVLFDRIVVVTAPEDHETRRVCEFWNVQCVLTDAFETRWGKFSKGRGINEGLAVLDKSDWLVHLDADILLPPLTRTMLELAELNPEFLFGIDRHICKGNEDWSKFRALPRLQHENRTWLHLDNFPMGTRSAIEQTGWGYIPLGFTQIWNAASGVLKYPDQHETASRTDVQFALKWPRGKRALIPEIVAYHLESEDSSNGANWQGRTTGRFGPLGTLAPAVKAVDRGDMKTSGQVDVEYS